MLRSDSPDAPVQAQHVAATTDMLHIMLQLHPYLGPSRTSMWMLFWKLHVSGYGLV
jgi:hypothetical protein